MRHSKFTENIFRSLILDYTFPHIITDDWVVWCPSYHNLEPFFTYGTKLHTSRIVSVNYRLTKSFSARSILRTQPDKIWSAPDATAHRITVVRRKIGTSRFRKEDWDGRCPVTSPRSMCWNQVVHLLQVSAYSSTALELLRPGAIKIVKTVKKKADLGKLCRYFKR